MIVLKQGVVQSVTELCFAEESNKKPAAEARADSIDELEKSLKLPIPKLNVVMLWLITLLKLKWLMLMKTDSIWRGSKNVLTDMKLLLLHNNP